MSQLDFNTPAKTINVLKTMGGHVQKSVQEAMPSFMRGQSQALLRTLYSECTKNPKLLECTPESLFGCTICVAQLGLMFGGSLGQAYLVPFWDNKATKLKATLIIGYKGYLQLVNRSGAVGVVNAFTVYEGDDFSVEYGSEPKLIHRPRIMVSADEVANRKPAGYYATVKTQYGSTFQYLSRAEAENHRDRFAMTRKKNGDVYGVWVDHFDAMAMKTAILRLCKYLPMSVEMQMAQSVDQSNEESNNGGEFDASQLFRASTDQIEEHKPEPSKVDQLRDRVAKVTTAEPITTTIGDVLTGLVNKLESLGGLAPFLEECGVTVEDITNTSKATRAAWCDRINAEIKRITN
jgi:recombination protein RecT